MLDAIAMLEIIDEIAYKPDYKILLKNDDPTSPGGRWYIQVMFMRVDVVTGKGGVGYSGKRWVSLHMTPGELVRAVFSCILALEEHEARENFTFGGKRIFGPHISLEALMLAADQTVVRA